MTVQSRAQGSSSQLAQVCIPVPSDGKPGETQHNVPIPGEDGTNLHKVLGYRLPPQAEVGDTLIFTKYETGWSLGLAKFTLPRRIVCTVPREATPGFTCMPITYKGFEVTRVIVPDLAKPGVDEIQLEWSSGSDDHPWDISLLFDPDHPEAVRNMALAVRQSALRAPPLNADVAFLHLVEAITEAGGYVNSKISRGCAPPLNVPGIIAREDIAEGETICSIPKDIHVSTLTAESNVPAFWQKMKLRGVAAGRTVDCGLYALGARLLHDAEFRAEHRQGSVEPIPQADWLVDADPKVRRVWEAYMDQLLSEDYTQHPVRRMGEDPDGMQNVLAPSSASTEIFKEVKAVHTLYRCAAKKSADIVDDASDELLGPRFESGMFLRSMLNHHSRAFKAAVSRSLVPVADLLNHAPLAATNVAWRYDEDSQAHVLKVIRAATAGQELLHYYGGHGNTCFHRCYGFTMPPQQETSWGYSMWKVDIPTIFESMVPESSDANTSEVFLNTADVSDSLLNLLNEIAQNGGNPAFFLRLACNACAKPFEQSERLRPALESLQRARMQNPCSHAWWEHLTGQDAALADLDEVRVQMSDYMCLVAHLEIVAYVAGEIEESKCLSLAVTARRQLVNHLVSLHETYRFT